MKLLTTSCFVLLLVCSCQAQSMEGRRELVEITEGIAKNLSEGNFEQVRETFDANMKNALNAAKLQQVWDGLVVQIGAYEELSLVISKELQGYRTIYQILKFEKAPFKLKAVFNEAN